MASHPHRPLTLLIALACALGLGVGGAHGPHGADAGLGSPSQHVAAPGRTAGHDHEHDEHGSDHEHEEHGSDHDHDHEHDADHDHGHDHDEADHHGHERDPHATSELAGVRLAVASLEGPELVVLDAAGGGVLGRFTLPSPGRVEQLADARLAAVTHPDANRVTFVHGGLSAVDHGDHLDLLQGPPYVLATVNLGPEPAHVFARGNDIAIFNAGDGSMVWLDARLLGISLDFVAVEGLGPDHGAVAVVGRYLIGGAQREGRVRVFDRDAAEVAHVDGCPGLRGQAALDDMALFGCDDGVLLVEVGGDGDLTATPIAYPRDGPVGARVGTLVADDASRTIAGDFGAGIALIDPAGRSLAAVALGAEAAALRFAHGGTTLVVLTVDGVLHALDPSIGEVRATLHVVDTDAPGLERPSLAVFAEHAFVADPASRSVAVVDLDRMVLAARFDLPFAPSSVAVLAIPGAITH
jgi:hypothetical protein